ncbi:hypothetical protein LK994_00965 [Ferruginibacter lapsinanis]|uniref:hypothetical protein n=1 Tax=Ferruginibacter lapsinanis TaxID=563172 RepID=UPI001E3D86AD|nr:hypothetical protein [Ferruginibacter lapsinanis]UEG50044.1 hypothetical protein LK994_00965 [Ferruginibacter lapsinanis]
MDRRIKQLIDVCILHSGADLYYPFYSVFPARRKKKATGFIGTLLLILLIPFIGYWIVELLSNKKAKGCNWCGNKYNEAEYCGLCGKNEAGETRPGFKQT